jgi:hypothetical protein
MIGPSLDILARQALWQHGLDYGHGTGHGVGHFLNVHEGPHGISSTIRQGSQMTTPLAPGMDALASQRLPACLHIIITPIMLLSLFLVSSIFLSILRVRIIPNRNGSNR